MASYSLVPPKYWSRRRDDCRKTVRELGRPGDDAGHLVPDIVGGLDIRANLVPQNGNLNRGEWQDKFEKSMRNCANNGNIFGYYKVEPVYRWGSSLRPDQLKVSMRTWSLWPFKIKYLEYYIHNDPSDWYDGDTRKKAKKWVETFSVCQG